LRRKDNALLDPNLLPSAHALAFLESKLRSVPDFPKPGIIFKDITPLLGDARSLRLTIDLLTLPFVNEGIEHVVAMEARGFLFGSAMALGLGAGFVPVRKPGKLPAATDSVRYALEYGESELHMHRGSIRAGARVLIVDDLLATGGTAAATADLVRGQGGAIAAFAFVVELDFLRGRTLLAEHASPETVVHSLVHVAGEA
jgi:adenine phosphoribosyltransferase